MDTSEMHLFRNSYSCVHGIWRWYKMASVQMIENHQTVQLVWKRNPKNMIYLYKCIAHIYYEMLLKYLLIHTKSVVTVIEGVRNNNNSKKLKKNLSNTLKNRTRPDSFDVWFFTLHHMPFVLILHRANWERQNFILCLNDVGCRSEIATLKV